MFQCSEQGPIRVQGLEAQLVRRGHLLDPGGRSPGGRRVSSFERATITAASASGLDLDTFNLCFLDTVLPNDGNLEGSGFDAEAGDIQAWSMQMWYE